MCTIRPCQVRTNTYLHLHLRLHLCVHTRCSFSDPVALLPCAVGAIGVKIVAPEIGRAVAGTPVLVVHPEDDVEVSH